MALQETHAVTGAFGFSGKYIAKRLLALGHEVRTLTNSPQRPNSFNGAVKAFPLAFHNIQALTEALEGVKVLYITYWVRFNHETFTHADAVRHTLTLFEAAKIAGVERVVYVSIANANTASPFEYFSCKGHIENALKASGLSYSILQPAMLFGEGGILMNNIAWTLRKMPVFCLFGDGKYHIQPIFVDDLAKLAVEQGALRDNTTLPAIGPENFTYRELVSVIGKAIKHERPMLSIPPKIGFFASQIIGKIMGDIFATEEEIGGLMADLLHVPGATPTGATSFSDWANENAATLGMRYQSELARRKNRTLEY